MKCYREHAAAQGMLNIDGGILPKRCIRGIQHPTHTLVIFTREANCDMLHVGKQMNWVIIVST